MAIILFFLFRSEKVTDLIRPSMPSPRREIERCVEKNVDEAVNMMLSQGGYIKPDNYKLYENTKIEYLCYTNQYYISCQNQEPLYINHLEKEIHDYIKPKIKDCFYSLTKDYKNRGYKVEQGPLSIDIELGPKQIKVDLDKELKINKEEESIEIEKFRYIINSPLYDLAIVAQEIASQEAKFCNFEYIGYSLTYPVDIEKDQVGSGETVSDIYKIKDEVTNKTLNIAIRSCAMPGGL